MKRTPIAPGATFGRWTYVGKAPPPKYGAQNPRGMFRCDCGVERSIRMSGVVGGRSRSCGCYGKMVQRAANATAYD